MSTQEIFFFIFSILAVTFSFLVVLGKNPISSAFSLVVVFFCLAGNYILLEAHLLAGMQILVYAGAIMVLFVFVIMLLNADIKSSDTKQNQFFKIASVLMSLGLLIILASVFKDSPVTGLKGSLTSERILELGGNTKSVASLIFSDYILPFELTSILLLVGIAGSVSLAKRKIENSK